MTNSRHNFNDKAVRKAVKYPPPFSLRLTFDERAKLDALRGSLPLGQYIREELLGDEADPRKRRKPAPLKDQEALGRALATLGSSRLSSNLNQLAKAVNTGSLPVTPETEDDLKEACAAVMAMRDALLRALRNGQSEGQP